MGMKYQKKISHSDFYDAFIAALTDRVTSARHAGDSATYCHIPADILNDVVQYCSCHNWKTQLSHITEGQAFYKIYGWEPL